MILLSTALTIFGLAGCVLVLARLWIGKCEPAVPELKQWPKVVTQLPIYNEPEMMQRVLGCALAMRYQGVHEVQLLDDSEVMTPVEGCRVIRRPSREGFKAGALAHGLNQTDAELVAIFDADFMPPPDFLERLVPQLIQHPEAAFIQARWGHLNADDSPLTLAQSAHIDAHFYVQQQARSAMNWLMNFNGSAGLWRVSAIQDAGGWQGDTLTEDLDLSHRAAMKGWRALYDDTLIVPAEIPTTWSAYRQQQHRWAMGTTQTLMKLWRPLWRSGLSLQQKLIGTLHLAQYLVQPLLLLHCLLAPWWPMNSGYVVMLGALLTALLPLLQPGRSRWKALPCMILMGSGMAWTGTLAVMAALAGKQQPFLRTPKGKQRASLSSSVLGEALLLTYTMAMLILHGPQLLPSVAMHLTGYAFVCIAKFMEGRDAS
jgi:cellulose synthase/poly-beta-1,6-N-acetylglucosamine synthase-like glycosyltransferase